MAVSMWLGRESYVTTLTIYADFISDDEGGKAIPLARAGRRKLLVARNGSQRRAAAVPNVVTVPPGVPGLPGMTVPSAADHVGRWGATFRRLPCRRCQPCPRRPT
jgi:hypothetical protein